jgi:UDP-N-acetylmuramoyl-L-alanyl-D-glutamate--2,6-diaminopimelate ligase
MTQVALSALLEGIAPIANDIPLTDLTLDSRQVRPGGAFLACRGARHHGLEFVAEVVKRGAAAILWEPDGTVQPPSLDSAIVVTPVPDLTARASLIADRFFASPSQHIDVIGVTGTNGKTTCAWLLAQALTACARPAAYLGTLGAEFGGQLVSSDHTTPDAITAQQQLADFAERGASAVAMEVSSHALVQHRVAAVHFSTAVFTNLTRDHLDYHGDMGRYEAAKASLFEREDIRLRVFNVDDAVGAQFAARPQFSDRIVYTQGATPQDGRYLRAHSTRYTSTGMEFALASSFGAAQIKTSLIGSFNVDNLLAVLAVLLGTGVPLQQCVAAVRDAHAPSGRLESFAMPGRPLVVVDYAHTPDALAKALAVLRVHCKGQLHCVFGCGGDRDRGKRPEMGAIAARLADRVVLTDDNPRSESAEAIIGDIKGGMGAQSVTVIHDRALAIHHAVATAGVDDVVLVAGKGHEAVQIVGDAKRPFRDQVVVREALALAGGV